MPKLRMRIGWKRKRLLILALVFAIFLGTSYFYFNYATYSNTQRMSPYVTEYFTGKNSLPNAITVDTEGDVWFILSNSTTLGEIIPSNGTFRQFFLPEARNSGLNSWGIASYAPTHLIWFTDEVSNSVWRFNETNSQFSRFELPTNGSFPFQIAVDDSGNAWFTEFFSHKLGEISTTGSLTEWNLTSSKFSEPAGIAISPNGTIWFTLSEARWVGSFYEGKIHLYDLRNETISPIVGIAIDSSGNLWLTQHESSYISEFNPKTFEFRTFSTSIPPLGESLPYFVCVDASGNVWVNEHYGNSIAEFNPQQNVLIEYKIPSEVTSNGNISGALTLAMSSNGQPWFTEYYSGKIGTVSISKAASIPTLKISTASNSTALNVVKIHENTSSTFLISFEAQSNYVASLSAAMGSYDSNLTTLFSKSNGTGNFTSTLSISNTGAAPGVYYLTVSASTQWVTVSKVLEVISV